MYPNTLSNNLLEGSLRLDKMVNPTEELPLYPRKNTLSEAINEIQGQLPITTQNGLMSALGLYHNTLVHLVNAEKRFEEEEGHFQ